MSINNAAMKLPPKPQGNSNVNYRLPPKPVYGQGGNSSNRSYDNDISRSREKSK